MISRSISSVNRLCVPAHGTFACLTPCSGQPRSGAITLYSTSNGERDSIGRSSSGIGLIGGQAPALARAQHIGYDNIYIVALVKRTMAYLWKQHEMLKGSYPEKDANSPQVNLKQIADQANLTVASVSRILRGKGRWLPETQEKVLRIASELRYRPNRLVRGLQSNQTQTIGVLFGAASSYYSRILAGIHQGLAEHDYLPVTLWGWLDMKGPDTGMSEAEREFRWIHRLIEHRIDGIILGPVAPECGKRHLAEIREHGLDVVAVDFDMSGVDVDYVGSDDALGGQLAAECLLRAGHRRLACIVASHRFPTVMRRMQACRDVVRQCSGASLEMVECDVNGIAGGERAGARLIDEKDRVTAIIATTDLIAAGVYRAAAARERRIPNDLSVIAFGPSVSIEALSPPLTILHQNPEEVGRTAARRMVHLRRCPQSDDKLPPERILIPPQLTATTSVTPPRVGAITESCG